MSGPSTFYHRYWMDQHIKVNPFDIHPEEWTDENFNLHLTAFKPYLSGTLLDYGCGDGQFGNRILPFCDRVYGVDICELAIESAKDRYSEIEFRSIDPEVPLPFPDEFFDTISAIDVMEHLLDTETILEEFGRVLKPGGTVLIATNELSRSKLLLITMFYFNTYFYPASPHIRYFTKKSLQDLLHRKDFEILCYQKNRTYLGYIPKGQFVVASKASHWRKDK